MGGRWGGEYNEGAGGEWGMVSAVRSRWEHGGGGECSHIIPSPLWSCTLPGQMEQGLFGIVTRIGTAFIEDQIVLLES